MVGWGVEGGEGGTGDWREFVSDKCGMVRTKGKDRKGGTRQMYT